MRSRTPALVRRSLAALVLLADLASLSLASPLVACMRMECPQRWELDVARCSSSSGLEGHPATPLCCRMSVQPATPLASSSLSSDEESATRVAPAPAMLLEFVASRVATFGSASGRFPSLLRAYSILRL